jgi:hypothetical protein
MSEQTKGTQPAAEKPGAQAPSQVAKRGEAAPPATPGQGDLEATIRAKMTAVGKKDFYKVGRAQGDGGQWEDVLAPNARVLQKWSNESDKPISTKIVHGMTSDEGCSVTVRGWIGDEAKPLVVKEETVSMHWAHELEWLLAEAVKHGITLEKKVNGQWQKQQIQPAFDLVGPDACGVHRIVLRDPEHQLHVLAQWYRTRRFGERVCTTKAESRIHRKLLSGEWRDEEEIQHEEEEMRAVASAQGISEPPGEAPAGPLPTDRLIPQGAPAGNGGKTVSPMAVTSLLTRFRDLGDKFPLPEGEDHRQYLLYAAIGLMHERGAPLTDARLEAMTPADSGKLWELVGKITHGDQQALATIDTLHAAGKTRLGALAKRGEP